MIAPKLTKERRKDVGTRRRKTAEDDLSSMKSVEIFDIFPGFGELTEALSGPGQEQGSPSSQAGSSAAPLQEGPSQFVLQLCDLTGQRGLGDVAVLGRGREGSAGCHGYEIPKLMNFHRHLLSNL
jgi:hypothetical protein